ncbi:MAG: PAS domain S-box protein, partial [Mariprofundus sp.]|nr:PAS domain S-box protein [Mariprofundus sp.]
MLVLDADLHVIFANRSFYHSFHVDEQETEGQRIYDLGNGQWDIPALRQLLEELLPQNTVFNDFEVEHVFSEIGQRTMLLNARRIYKEHEKTQFILLAIEDITGREQAEVSLAEAQHIGHMGSWEFDVIQNTGRFSDESYRIVGVANDYTGSFKSFLRLVHPADRELVKQASRKAFSAGNFSNVQYRIIRPDGSVRFVQTNGKGQRDESGQPYRVFGTIQDITERKQAEEKFQTVFHNSNDAIFIHDLNGNILDANNKTLEIFGY